MALAVSAECARTLHRMLRQLEDLRGRLAAGPRAIEAGSRALARATERLGAHQEELKKARLAVDQKQLQLRSIESRILDCEAKRNGAKTNREYQLLGEQKDADAAAKAVLEDEILEALERVDALRGGVPALEEEVAAAKKSLESTQRSVAQEQGAVEAEVSRVSADLERAELDMPADALEAYRRVVKRKGADAMAALDGEGCGGCFQQLPANTVAELSAGRVLSCRSCGRLLYAPRGA